MKILNKNNLDFQVELFDVHGRSLIKQNNQNQNNISGLSNGMYILKFLDIQKGYINTESIVIKK